MTSTSTVLCPYCAEPIQPKAAKCRWCGEMLKPGRSPARSWSASAVDQSSEATTILVLGILGLVLCAICGMFAWSKGNAYLRSCRIRRIQPSNAAVAGRILGMIATILMAVQLIIVVVWVLLMASTGA